MQARVLLLTGTPGVGKTTVLRAVPELLPGLRLAGFTTAEIRSGGRRTGFHGTTLEGAEEVIAHVRFRGAHRVGRYGVDAAAIGRLAAALSLRWDVDAYLLDEIGKMECFSAPFVDAVRRLLAAPASLVATVALRGGGLIAEVKEHPGATIWQVTHNNRAALPARIAAWLSGGVN